MCVHIILDLHILYNEKPVEQIYKHLIKMYKDVDMAMTKTIETRCRYGSMQARQG